MTHLASDEMMNHVSCSKVEAKQLEWVKDGVIQDLRLEVHIIQRYVIVIMTCSRDDHETCLPKEGREVENHVECEQVRVQPCWDQPCSRLELKQQETPQSHLLREYEGSVAQIPEQSKYKGV